MLLIVILVITRPKSLGFLLPACLIRQNLRKALCIPMRDRPSLSDDAILATLRARYGLVVAELTFLPLGADAGSAVFRADDVAGASYLVKLRTGEGFGAPSLAVPHSLSACGLPHIVAPMPSLDGSLWAVVDGLALALYPFLEARTATESGLSDAQWQALGETTRQIHEHALPSALRETLSRERFVPSRRELLGALQAVTDRPDASDPIQRDMAALWDLHRETIATLVTRADGLGCTLRSISPALPLVLCHADLHTWNILVDDAQQLWLVDWDEVMLAPKERDLMFVIGGIARDLVSPHQTACFLQGYGQTKIHTPALAYYRYAWAVQEIAAWGESALLTPTLSVSARRDAARAFESIFAPGNIAALALASPTG